MGELVISTDSQFGGSNNESTIHCFREFNSILLNYLLFLDFSPWGSSTGLTTKILSVGTQGLWIYCIFFSKPYLSKFFLGQVLAPFKPRGNVFIVQDS